MQIQSFDSPTPANPLRRKLLLGLPSGAMLASPLALVSCGGGGSDDPAAPPTAVATLRLPTAVAAKDMTLVAADAEQPVSGATASVLVSDEGPTLVGAVHSSGRLVAMGLLRAGAEGQTLGARSSAEALLFMALAGSLLGATDRTRLLALVHSDANVDTLAALIETRWKTDPFVLDDPDATIGDAVIAAVAALRASASAAPAGAGQRVRALAAQPLQRIEPSDAVSGVVALQADGSDGAPGIKLQNNKRRRGIAHVYETAYTPVDGSQIELGLARVQYERIDVPPTQSLSIFSALGVVAGGTVPWSPVETARYGLPMHAGAEETVYETAYLTPVWDRPEPEFFLAARYSLARFDWRQELADLYTASQLDLVFSAVLEALGVGGQQITASTLEQSIAALRAGASGTPDVIALLEQAGAGKALLAGWRAFLVNVSSGNAIVSGAYRVAVATVVRQANAQLAENIAAANLSAGRLTLFRAAVRALLLVTVVAGVVDTAAQYRDLHEGEPGHLVTSTLVAPKVLISPSSGKLPRGNSMTLTARVTGAQDVTLKYRWTLSGSDLANLSDGAGQIGMTFETDRDTVTLATTGSTQGTLKIVVEAFVVRGAAKDSLGTASASIEVDATAFALTPASARIARTGGTQSFTFVINPAPADAASLSYEWKCTSQYGSVASGGNTTSSAAPVITSASASGVYTGRSDNEGGTFETIEVTAFSTTSGLRVELGKASAEVFIKQQYNLIITPAECDVPTNTMLPLTGNFEEPPPLNATVKWTWSHSGTGTLTPPADSGGRTSLATLDTGSAEAVAVVTVQAVVSVPGQPDFKPLPATVGLRVKKGVRTITFVASGGAFSYACGTSPTGCTYGAFLVPIVPGATKYTAVFTDFAYGPCNRSLSWTTGRGDIGGCEFPITYHPFQPAQAPTSTWAVWMGFSDTWNPGNGKCTVTITLPA